MRTGSKDKKKKYSIGFIHAWNGLAQVAKTERNFRIHMMAALLVLLAGIVVGLSPMEWTAIFLVFGMVFVSEMMNTVVERMIDYLKPETHPLAKTIKDIAAGAVLVSAIIAVIVGLLIFIP